MSIDDLVQNWLKLSEDEQQEFSQRISQVKENQTQRTYRNDSFDLGPISQNHCPYCGK